MGVYLFVPVRMYVFTCMCTCTWVYVCMCVFQPPYFVDQVIFLDSERATLHFIAIVLIE